MAPVKQINADLEAANVISNGDNSIHGESDSEPDRTVRGCTSEANGNTAHRCYVKKIPGEIIIIDLIKYDLSYNDQKNGCRHGHQIASGARTVQMGGSYRSSNPRNSGFAFGPCFRLDLEKRQISFSLSKTRQRNCRNERKGEYENQVSQKGLLVKWRNGRDGRDGNAMILLQDFRGPHFQTSSGQQLRVFVNMVGFLQQLALIARFVFNCNIATCRSGIRNLLSRENKNEFTVKFELGLRDSPSVSRTMSVLSVCSLFHLFQVILPQPIVSLSPPVQTLPAGSLAKFSCRIGSTMAKTVFWYKQRERNDMKLVYTTGKYLSAKDRFSSEIHEKEGNYSLIIANAQRNDSGIYYCATHNYKLGRIFANGSKLIITEGSPSIFLLIPTQDVIPSMERIPLLCLVRGLNPDSFPVRWNVAGRDTEGHSDSATIEPDGTYTIRSHASVSVDSWRSGTPCICAVQINASELLLSESVSSQRDSLSSPFCIFTLSAILAALLLLGLLFVALRRMFRKRQSVIMNSDEELAVSRSHPQNKETIYADLAFKQDSRL
ncbi:uncharacterized protein LOC119957567 [Scyliorhinus canicula]|uniref:uncharacterized protein LOC119957567 n=1 Tax=Scyliorhinus canicula TaxID=7830 RepID=UPI0018F640AE|nr:uncharacterized protein LOC119957567 [Scyliorhinus canicula]